VVHSTVRVVPLIWPGQLSVTVAERERERICGLAIPSEIQLHVILMGSQTLMLLMLRWYMHGCVHMCGEEGEGGGWGKE